MAWDTTNTNKNPTDCFHAWWLLFERLVAAGWTQVGSGDGVNGWGNTVDGTIVPGPVSTWKPGALGFNNNNSWIRFRMPTDSYGNKFEFLVYHYPYNYNTFKVYWSLSAGFVTGGSPTEVPTATDGDMWSDSTNWDWRLIPDNGTYRFHAVVGDAAEGYCFWMSGWPLYLGGNPLFFFGLDKGTPIFNWDTNPYILHHAYWKTYDNGLYITLRYQYMIGRTNTQYGSIGGRTSVNGVATTIPGLWMGWVPNGDYNGGCESWYVFPMPPDGQPKMVDKLRYPYKGMSHLFRMQYNTPIFQGATADENGGTKNLIAMGDFWLPWGGIDPIY